MDVFTKPTVNKPNNLFFGANTFLIYGVIINAGLFLMLLIIYPQIDLNVSKTFYSTQEGFIYRNNLLVTAIFKLIPLISVIYIIGCSTNLAWKLFNHKKIKNILLSSTVYLIISGLIGPGLIVNVVFKENFGRARPFQTTEFNGPKQFSPALFITNQCKHNGSFSSGHAAMAYYFSAIAYLLLLSEKKPKQLNNKYSFFWVYIISLLFGSLVGFGRILMGGHFLRVLSQICLIITAFLLDKDFRYNYGVIVKFCVQHN